MTDLQLSLMAIGGTILVAVFSYNKWQEYRAKKRVQRAFSNDHDDVLMTPAAQQGRYEPSLSQEGDPAQADAEPSFDAEQFDPVDANVATAHAVKSQAANPQAAKAAPAVQKELPVDDMIDCAIPIMIETPVYGDKIIRPLQSLRHVGNKPVHFIGQREDGNWDAIAHGVAYTALMAGVQLANRSSVLNELEYSELVTRLRQVCDEFDAEPTLPDMTSVIHSARALHQFVAEYDAQLSVNIHSNGPPWAISTLLASLERQGFDIRTDGHLIMSDGEGGILFSLSTNVTLAAEDTARLTLLLNVPCVARQRDGFGAMIACAKMLATRLGGVIVDDAGQALSDVALQEIATQVSEFYDNMEKAEIPAGSTRALRLFN